VDEISPAAQQAEPADEIPESHLIPRAASPKSPWREALIIVAILAGILCIGYANVVFGRRSLVYTDNYNPLDARFLPQNYGPDLVPADTWTRRNLQSTANFHDPGGVWWQWEPGGEFLRRGLARGEWPWWDPYVGAGAPAMANLSQTFFFPPYFLVVALGNSSLLKNAYFLTLLLFAGACSYALLRRHGLSREGSLVAAAAVMFCGGLSQNVGSMIGQTAALLPAALLVTRWFIDRPSLRRTAALAVAYATIALSSFPPVLLPIFGISAAYTVTLVASGVAWRQRLARYLVAVLLSLGAVAFYYLPAAMAGRGLPQVQRTYKGAGSETVRTEALSQLLSPVVMGGGAVYRSPPMPDIADPRVPYVGLAVLLLAGLAAPAGRRDSAVLLMVLVVSGALLLLKLIGVMPVHWLGRLPGFDQIHYAHYLGIPLSILFGLAAGFGVDRLLSGGAGRLRLGLVAGGLLAALLALPAVAYLRGVFAHREAATWLERWYLLLAVLVVTGSIAALRPAAGRGRRTLLAALLLAVVAGEGMLNAAYPRQRRWDLWRHPVPYVQELQARRNHGRVFSAAAFNANAPSAFEVFSLDSLMTFNTPRIFEFYKRFAAPNAYLFLREATQLPPDGALDAANVGLLALRDALREMAAEARSRGYERVWSDGEVSIFARATEPRYYFSSQFRVVTDAEALSSLARRRPRREMLLESEPGFPPAANVDTDPEVAARVERNRVELSLRAPRPGLVYCAESNAPGWRAWVNGAPAPIVAANYAFRAVPVPAGPVTVELRYLPPGLPLGAMLTATALLGMAVLAGRRERGALDGLEFRSQPRLRLAWRRALLVGGSAVVLVGLGFEAEETAQRLMNWKKLSPPRALATARQPEFYRVEWRGVVLPPRFFAGGVAEVTVALRNAGSGTWPDPRTADPERATGAGAVRLGYRWWRETPDEIVSGYSERVDLPRPLEPGEAVSVEVPVQAPALPGRYRLQIDLVHELVSWFESRGAERLIVPVEVEASVAAESSR
jgi:hypothetical protein